MLLLLIVAFLALLLGYMCYRLSLLKKKVRRRTHEATQAVHTAFDLLKEDIQEHIKLLEKAKSRRELTQEEEKILKQLKRDVDDAERFIKKEIDGITKK